MEPCIFYPDVKRCKSQNAKYDNRFREVLKLTYEYKTSFDLPHFSLGSISLITLHCP